MSHPSAACQRATSTCVAAGVAVATLWLAGPPVASAAEDPCPNAAVRAQQGVTSLPDCRAYELVNPATDDYGDTNRISNIADNGSAAAFLSVVASDAAQGAGVASITVARRSPTGWTSVEADPTSIGGVLSTGSTLPKVFSPDFSRELLITSLPAVPGDENSGNDYYRLDVGLGNPVLMSTLSISAGNVIGATPNLDSMVFVGSDSSLYVSDGHSLELLSVFPDGSPVPVGQMGVAGAAYQRGLGVGEERDADPWVERGGVHAVSDDAQRVYFYDSFASDGGYLYVRDRAASPKRTVAVSASARAGDGGAVRHALFISAAHDGSTAYFVSQEQLTDVATPGGGIYHFELATGALTQITPDAGDVTGLNLAGAITSDDQSHIYFMSTSALKSGAQAGDNNAYVWTNARGVRFIAKVGAGDRFSRVTPDGRFALLTSGQSIGGASNNGFAAIYRYDDAAAELTCVSCRPDGSPSQGAAELDAQSFGFPAGSINHNRALTADGGVVFTSTDQVVSVDQSTARDVYIYERGGTSLLSVGRGDTDSYVGDVSDDGRNVFIITRSALVNADRDAAELDVYDIRVDGGFPEPPPPTDPCHGEDCLAPPTPPNPGRYTSSGSQILRPGNPAQTRPAKKLSMSALTASQRATLARTGKVSIRVRVTGGGTVSVRGRGRIAGRAKSLGSVKQTLLKESATSVPLVFKLSTAARHELARRHRLSLTLEARLSGLSRSVSTTARLTRAQR